MIEIKNNTASLGLEAGDTFENVEEMRSLVSDWLLEGGMESSVEREQYIDRWMEEVSYDEVDGDDEEESDEEGKVLWCEECQRETPRNAGSQCQACGTIN